MHNKSFSLNLKKVLAKQKVLDDENINGKKADIVVASSSAGDLQVTFMNPEPVKEEQANGVYDTELSSSNGGDLKHEHLEKVVELNSERKVEGGSQNSLCDVEAELCERRLSLLVKIEKQKQAEESLNSMQSQWERIRQWLSLVGIILPADLTAISEDKQLSYDPVEDLVNKFTLLDSKG